MWIFNLRILYVVMLLQSFFYSASAQEKKYQKITIGGVVTENNLMLNNALVSLIVNEKKIKQMPTTAKGTFVFNLEPSSEYTIIVSKDGYTSKKLFVSTNNIPADLDECSWTTGITVDIFKLIAGLDVSILEQPICKIYYSDEKKNLDYDKEYTKSIQAQIDLLQSELNKKREELIKLALEKQKEQERIEQENLRLALEAEKKAKEDAKKNALMLDAKKRQEKASRDSLIRIENIRKMNEQKQKFIYETKQKKELETKQKNISDSLLAIKLAKKKIDEENSALLAFELAEKKRKEADDKARADSARYAMIKAANDKKNEEIIKSIAKSRNENTITIEDKKKYESIFETDSNGSPLKVTYKFTLKDSASEEIAKATFNRKLTADEKDIYQKELLKNYEEGIAIEIEKYPNIKTTKILSINGSEIIEYKVIEFQFGSFYKKNDLDITKPVFNAETKGYEKYVKQENK